MDIAGKRLLVLGATNTVCDIVHEAKKLGIKTFVADYYPDSPAKKIADGSFLVSATDVDALVDVCRENKIDGVFTGYLDILLPACQKVCEKLEKPFCGNEENINMCIDKVLFKDACARSGVRVVPWQRVSREDYLEKLDAIDVPVVIKPADYSGSKGVYKCFDKSEMQGYVEKALSYSRAGKVLIEKVMDAHKEFTAYYMLYKGNAYLCAMGDRYVDIIDPTIAPVGKGMLYPSVYLDEWVSQMDSAVQKFFRDNNMTDGFAFLQGFYDDGLLYIHEIGYRLNGGYTYDIIQHFSGYHQVHELVRYALTGEMDEDAVKKSNPYFDGLGMIVTISLKPGTISTIAGVSDIKELYGVLDFHQLHNVGDALLSHGTTAQVFAYVLCGVRNKEELDSLIHSIDEKLVVLDENGSSMRRDIIDTNMIKVKKYER